MTSNQSKMKNRVTQHINIIKNIPLFADFSENELSEILKNSQIKTCEKGEILFSKDQKALNFYIVLDGLAKLFISNLEGEEAIIAIADSGKSLANLFSDVFSTDAHIMENSTILSLPLKNFREQVRKNPKLAVNMLLDASSQNKSFVNQIGQLKLGNAQQKLGQFLLEMAFEKGDKIENINLKYDKNMIASYLGIKPETLSRTLKKLKKDGEISVKKRAITLLQKNSLCQYCNSEIATKCTSRGSDFCEQN